MPAYAKGGKCVCFFRADTYLTLGFTEQANLFDEGTNMQPSSFALKNLTAAEVAKISAIVKKAVSETLTIESHLIPSHSDSRTSVKSPARYLILLFFLRQRYHRHN